MTGQGFKQPNRTRDNAGQLSLLAILAFTATTWPLTVAQLSLPFVAPFYSASFGLTLSFVGVVLTFGRLIDVVSDIFVAWASDRTRTRWGRRKPWIVCGLLLYIPATILLFLPGTDVSATRFVLTTMLFFFSWTLAFIPFLSQGTELSDDYHVKNRINLVQSAVGLVSLIFGFGLPLILIDPRAAPVRLVLAGAFDALSPSIADYLRAPSPTGTAYYGRSMLVITIMGLAPLLVTLPSYILTIRETVLSGAILKGRLTSAFRNRIFQRFAIGYLFMMIGYMGRSGLMPFVLSFGLHLPDSYLFFMMLMFVSSLAITPLWARLLRRFERIPCLIIAAMLEASGLSMLFLAPAGSPWITGLAFIVMGLPGQTLLMVPYLIAADCADYSLWKTGADSRALHISLCSLLVKLGSVFAGIAVWLAGTTGFDPTHAVQPPHVVLGVKIIGLGIPVACLTLGSLIVLRFPLNRRRHAALRSRIMLRERGVADDPSVIPSGVLLPLTE